MSPRDPRPVRVRGVGRGEGGSVVLSIDVDGVHGEAGPPLKAVMTADEARLTGQLILEAAGRRRDRLRPAPSLMVLSPADDDDVDLDEAPVVAAEGWGGVIGRHVRGLLGFRSAGAADPRAPP